MEDWKEMNRGNWKLAGVCGGVALTALACAPRLAHKFAPKSATANEIVAAKALDAKDSAAVATYNDVPVKHKAPKRQIIRAADLPAPYATRSADNGPNMIARPDNAGLTVPPGFHIYVWAENLNNPRIAQVAPNGDVFVAESGPNRVVVLRDAKGTGKADVTEVFTNSLKQPFGIAFFPPGQNPTHVYVANTDSVVRFPYHNGDLKANAEPEMIIPDLPGGGYHQHWTRDVVFRADGKKMYVSVGSQANVEEGEETQRAAISEFNPDGTGRRLFASGIRNPVGLAINPVDKSLWTSVNERDGLGDDLVPDYATSVKDGGFYGWPNYYIGQNHDPRTSEKPELKARAIVPDVLFTSHVAALGISFYTASQFPAEYKNSAFVAEHGSWNRLARSGYQVVRIPIGKNGKATGGFEPFVSGWTLGDGRVWGRPVSVVTAKDGSLLITDDGGGKIWRVVYTGK